MNNNTADVNNGTSCTLSILSTDVKVVVGFDFFFVAVAVFLHVIGIVLIVKEKFKNISVQNILLVHLSLTSILNVCTNATAIYWTFKNTRFTKDFITVYYIAHMAYILNLTLLSLDRFLFIVFPLLYRVKVTQQMVLLPLAILWLFSIIFGLLIKFHVIFGVWFYTYASYIYNGLVIVFSATVYIFIVYKVYRSTRTGVTSLRMKKKLVVIPMLIVFTFFLFAFLPHLIAYNVTYSSCYIKKLVRLGLIGVNVLNNISDPLIYVFFQRSIRKRLNNFFRSFRRWICCEKKRYHFEEARFYSRKKTSDISQHSETNAVDLNPIVGYL